MDSTPAPPHAEAAPAVPPGAELTPPLSKEVRESALLLGLMLVVLGLAAALASTTLLLS